MKPEISEEECTIIEQALANLPDWMAISWKIAWHQGCRLAETSLPLSDVDLKAGTHHLHPEGGTSAHDQTAPRTSAHF
jgi:hypothetical protein